MPERIEVIALNRLQVADTSKLLEWSGSLPKIVDGVGETTLREGLRNLVPSLSHVLTERENTLQWRMAERENFGKDIPPQRRSFQWLAGMFEGVSQKFEETGVYSYDPFVAIGRTSPDTQLEIIQELKKATAGTIGAWVSGETRKVRGQQRGVSEKTAKLAEQTFMGLEELEKDVIARMDEKLLKEARENRIYVGDVLKKAGVPVTALTTITFASLILASCVTEAQPTQNVDTAPIQTQAANPVDVIGTDTSLKESLTEQAQQEFTTEDAAFATAPWIGVEVELNSAGVVTVGNFTGVNSDNGEFLFMSSMSNGEVEENIKWVGGGVQVKVESTGQLQKMNILLKHISGFTEATNAYAIDLVEESGNTATFRMLEFVDGKFVDNGKRLIIEGSTTGNSMKIVDGALETILVEPVDSLDGEAPPTQVPSEFVDQFVVFKEPQVWPVEINNVGASLESEIDTILVNEASVEFPNELTSTYKDDNFSFEFKLSKDLVRYSGIDQFQLPEEMARKLTYQALSEIFYGLSEKDPNFADFKNLGIGRGALQDQAEEAVDNGILNNTIKLQDVEGKFNALDISLVTKEEFDTLAAELQERNILFAWRPYKDSPKYNWDMESDTLVLFTESGTLKIIIYNNGRSSAERNSPDYPPLYYQQPGRANDDYLRSIDFDLERGMMNFRVIIGNSSGQFSQLIAMESIFPDPDDGQTAQEARDAALRTAFGN